jgi:Uma2 family endonuclease
MAYPQPMATEWTAAMVAALPDDGTRYEVLDGELVIVPAPSWDQQRLALAFRDALSSCLRVHGIGEAIVAPATTPTPSGSCWRSKCFRRRPRNSTAG